MNALSILDNFEDRDFAAYVPFALEKVRAGETLEGDILASLICYPVSMREFITHPDYLDQAGSIYPRVLDELEALNNPPAEGLAHGLRIGSPYTESIFTGGIGVGKSHCALLTMAYHLYVLSCIDDPQGLFDLDPSSEILFVFQTISATLAKQLDFARFKAMLDRSPYFRDVFPYRKGIESELQFTNRIIVRPVNGLESGTIGQNIYAALLDEVNFLEITEHSKKNRDGGEYDQAIQLYNSIASRRKSRFMKQGRMMGMLCLVSSKRYPNQFTDRKVAQAQKELHTTGKTSIYVYDKRRWDIKPDDYCGETFKVFMGDMTRKPRILSKGGPEANQELIVDIPIEYRPEFENDIMRALREVAGLSTLSTHPFMQNIEAVSSCFGHHQSILNQQTTDFQQSLLKVLPQHIQHPQEQRYIHVDLALTTDSAGVVCGYVSGFKKVQRGQDITETLPVITIDFALEVAPPQGGEIQISRIRELVYNLRDKACINIQWISFDQYQSADSIQVLRQKGFTTGIQSMDRTPVPYEVLKQALYDGRVKAPSQPKLQEELMALEFNPKKNKVNHTSQSTKDVSDALAGVVFGLSQRREVWSRFNINPMREASELLRKV